MREEDDINLHICEKMIIDILVMTRVSVVFPIA